MSSNPYGAQSTVDLKEGSTTFYRLSKLDSMGITDLDRLPFSIRVLLENVLRNSVGKHVTESHVDAVANWNPVKVGADVPFMPSRVILQDFTGVPAVVDLAAMRDGLKSLGGDPRRINPVVPVDLVIDHSVQVDFFGSPEAYRKNVEREFVRNRERYTLLRWAQDSFKDFRVVPPGTGIVHQVNLEYLASVVQRRKDTTGTQLAFPDTLVGTDSHTTMINGLGVVGWGVGGIEAEAVLTGQPYYMLLPEVVGVKFSGKLPEGSTATDLVLHVVQMLRKYGVVGNFVEYFGPGLSNLSLPDRATLANMAPEYGATVGFFPVDQETISYLRGSGRPEHLVERVEVISKEQSLFRTDETPDPSYTHVLHMDLSTVEPSVAGPKRPQDRIPLHALPETFENGLADLVPSGFTYDPAKKRNATVHINGEHHKIGDGEIVIAAITSCTNTSNPSVMIGAGLLAKKAVEYGLMTKPWVKSSMAPGSKVVTDYLEASGLMKYLEELKFGVVGYGCTTCIGNSGPLPESIVEAIKKNGLVVASVLSGNRNFEARIHSDIRANFLTSPMLVVAYALTGNVHINWETESIGNDPEGSPVFLRDIWPSSTLIHKTLKEALDPSMYKQRYAEVFEGNDLWKQLPLPTGDKHLYDWDDTSTYIRNPPFFKGMSLEVPAPSDISGARVLGIFGHTTTTDHISPAGAIPKDEPSGQYLRSNGVEPREFNTFGSRRGSHEVMIRGTFGNIRIRNLLLNDQEGGRTLHIPSGEVTSIYEAAMKYQSEGTPLVILAGREYGTGSSRDWAAKGTSLLGVKAVIAESYERIHRSNLVGMGVLPLQFEDQVTPETLGLSGKEIYNISGVSEGLYPSKCLTVIAQKENGEQIEFNTVARLDSEADVEYYQNGGILQTVLRNIASENI